MLKTQTFSWHLKLSNYIRLMMASFTEWWYDTGADRHFSNGKEV